MPELGSSGNVVFDAEDYKEVLKKLSSISERISEISTEINKSIDIKDSRYSSILMNMQDINMELVKMKNVIGIIKTQAVAPF